MKADETTRHIPVLIVSGVEELDSVVRCIELGASDYLPKPINASHPGGAHQRVAGRQAAARLERDMERRRAEPDDRAPEGGAQPLPLAAGRRPRLLSRRRAAAGRTSARDHGRLLRPARLHRVRRAGRSRGADGAAAPVPPHDGRGDHRARRNAGALRRRRGDGLLQRPDRAGATTSSAACAWPSTCAIDSPTWPAAGASVATSSASALGSRSGTPPSGASASRAATTTAPSATSPSSPRGCRARPRPDQILLSPRAQQILEELVESEPVGELTLKGMARPVFASNVLAIR